MTTAQLFKYRKQLERDGFKEEAAALLTFLFDERLSAQELSEITNELIAEGKLPEVKE